MRGTAVVFIVGEDCIEVGAIARRERVVAFVTASDGTVTPARVRDWCAERLSDYKVPSDVIVDTAPLPRNANGKIQKAELRHRASALTSGETRA